MRSNQLTTTGNVADDVCNAYQQFLDNYQKVLTKEQSELEDEINRIRSHVFNAVLTIKDQTDLIKVPVKAFKADLVKLIIDELNKQGISAKAEMIKDDEYWGSSWIENILISKESIKALVKSKNSLQGDNTYPGTQQGFFNQQRNNTAPNQDQRSMMVVSR